ncbi:MAG: hypothetical protein HKN43_04815 [Rhodothermales bacterium]|nr:hypothetical protein [Rhodothermales bacterium]
MSQICINVPGMKANQTINVAVTVNGKTRSLNYRVETFPWSEELDSVERIDVLRTFIKDYADDWNLVQIGPPENNLIPVMFKQRTLERAIKQ